MLNNYKRNDYHDIACCFCLCAVFVIHIILCIQHIFFVHLLFIAKTDEKRSIKCERLKNPKGSQADRQVGR